MSENRRYRGIIKKTTHTVESLAKELGHEWVLDGMSDEDALHELSYLHSGGEEKVEYIKRGDEVYKATYKEEESYEDIFEKEEASEGTKFFTQFYDGGTNLSETIQENAFD